MRVGFCPVSVNNTNKVQPITNEPLTAKVEKMILHASVSACRFCFLRGSWSMPMVSTAKTQNRGASFRAAPRFHAPSPLVSPSASRRPALPRLAPCRVANGCLERTIERKWSMRSVPTGRSAAANARRSIPRQRFCGGTVAAPLRQSGIGYAEFARQQAILRQVIEAVAQLDRRCHLQFRCNSPSIRAGMGWLAKRGSDVERTGA